MQIEVTERPWDDADATALRAAQRAEIDARYGPGSEPGPAPTAADVAVFLVAYVRRRAGRLRGAAAARRRRPPRSSGCTWSPACAGSGVSTAVLEALENHAAERGWLTLKLETGPKQPEAIRFYERSGYVAHPQFRSLRGARGLALLRAGAPRPAPVFGCFPSGGTPRVTMVSRIPSVRDDAPR